MTRNVTEMEHMFKADLIGWLEYEQKYQDSLESTQSVQNLLDTFSKTLEYFKNSQKAFESLHNVLFQAFTKQKDYMTDFDVPPFEHGVDQTLFIKITQHFDLSKYTCYALWTIPSSDAIEFIINVPDDTSKPYHTTFIKLIQLNEFEDLEYATNKFGEQVSKFKDDAYTSFVIQRIYECLVENNDKSSKDRLLCVLSEILALIDIVDDMDLTDDIKYQLSMFSELYNDPEMFKDYMDDTRFSLTQFKTCQNKRQEQHCMRYDWEHLMWRDDDTLTARQKTFMVICDHMRAQYFPSSNHHADPIELKSFARLELENMKHTDKDYVGCKNWCCFVIKHRGTFWKSVLKTVVQFMDIWISEIQIAECSDMFANLISKENLSLILYENILKHVQLHNVNGQHLTEIKSSVGILEQTIEKMEDLATLRNSIYEEWEANQKPQLPTFGSMTFWNIPFETKMIKISNQITKDNYLADEMILEISRLSVIWPYQVVRTLFLACAQNPKQYSLVIPVLQKLGKLCRLKKYGTKQDSLLLLVIKDCVSEFTDDEFEANIARFIQHCFYQKDVPVVLTAESRIDHILDFREFMSNFVNANLEKKDNWNAEKLAIHCLSLFCDDFKTDINISSPPIILDTLSSTALMRLTDQTWNIDAPLVIAEMVHSIIQKYSAIAVSAFSLNYLTRHSLELYTHLSQSKQDVRPHWFNFLTGIANNKGETLNVFRPLLAVLTCEIDKPPGFSWWALFEGCAISPGVSDLAFQEKYLDVWKKHMGPVYENAFYDEEFLSRLRYVLHPSAYQCAIPVFYENLLQYFLKVLYDRLELRERVKTFTLEPSELNVFLSRLDDTDLRLYFISKNIYGLLHVDHTEKPNHFYTTNLIKSIQTLATWGDISGPVQNYKNLKSKFSGRNDTGVETLVYYPVLDTPELVSHRALSILVLYDLCILYTIYPDDTRGDIVYRLIVHVLEGLIDKKNREQFNMMYKAQPKNRRRTWNQRNDRVYLQMRPVLMQDEMALVLPVIQRPEFKKSKDILHILTDAKDNGQKLYVI